MTLTNARATYGLNARATPTATNVTGPVQIGANNVTETFSDADVAYSLRAIVADGATLAVALSEGTTTGSTEWGAGTAQVETATAAGTITGAGNASVVVTSAGMSGSPLTVSVAVANGDTAATWAGKVRTALAANATIAARFTVSGSTTAIVLTRKPTSTFTVGATTVNIYPANDTTLNISLDNGTCTGITTAGTSTNTTSGVATSGCQIFDGDGKDFEGVTIPTIDAMQGTLIKCNSGSFSIDSIYMTMANLGPGGVVQVTNEVGNGLGQTDFVATGASDISITVIGIAE
jgi:hypothetical protein